MSVEDPDDISNSSFTLHTLLNSSPSLVLCQHNVVLTYPCLDIKEPSTAKLISSWICWLKTSVSCVVWLFQSCKIPLRNSKSGLTGRTGLIKKSVLLSLVVVFQTNRKYIWKHDFTQRVRSWVLWESKSQESRRGDITWMQVPFEGKECNRLWRWWCLQSCLLNMK